MSLPPVTTGLLFCLQAGSYTGVVSDGAAVSTWTDQSASGNNATVAGTPRWYQGLTPNGKPALQFANDGDFTFANNTMFSGATSGELFIVVKSNSTNTQGPWNFGGNNDDYHPFSDAKTYNGAFTNTRYSWTAPTPSAWHIYNISHDGSTRTTLVDGSSVHSVSVGFTAPHSSTRSTLRIGHGGTARFTGRVAEVLAYSASLGGTDRSDVYDYLYDTYLAPASTTALPVTSALAFHWQAEAYAGADNDYIRGLWLDVSGNHNDGTVVNTTHQRTGRTPLGTRSVVFAGGSTGGYYTFTNNTIYNSPTTAGELFVVAKAGATDNPGPLAFGGADSFYPHPSGVGGNSIYDGEFQASGARRNFGNPGVGSWGVYNVSHDGTTKICRFNGSVVDTATLGYTAPGSTDRPTLTVGWPTGLSTKFNGEIAEVLGFTRALNSTERGDVFDFLYGRHITAPPIVLSIPTAALTLTASGPAALLNVAVPTAALTVHASGPGLTGPPLNLSIPTAALSLTAAPPTVTTMLGLSVPTAALSLTATRPVLLVATITLVSPLDTTLIPAARPAFTVSVVTADTGAQVQIQYDTDAGFSTPTTLTAGLIPGLATIPVTVRATTDLADATVYHWRARVGNTFDTTAWSDPFSFTTSFADGDALASGTWTVSTATTPAPHLWFVLPARGQSGDTATAYGTAFGPTSVAVTIAGVTATVTAWDTHTADADATTADRVINPGSGHACPAHQSVTFTVPDGAYPGGPLYVIGS